MSKKNLNILTVLADNEALLQATKELILKHFAEVPYAEGASDELLGQLTRARMVGRQKVEAAFKELEGYKSTTPIESNINPAY